MPFALTVLYPHPRFLRRTTTRSPRWADRRRRFSMTVVMVMAAGWVAISPSGAVERLSLQRDGTDLRLEGRVLVEAQDGSMLFQTRDGVIWVVGQEEIQSRTKDDVPFTPLERDVFGRELLRQLPSGFRLLNTDHYVVAYNTSQAYAQWCSSLLERLNTAYRSFWKKHEFDLHESEFPLAVVIFDDQRDYAAYSRAELGEATSAVIGYYNFRTNQMVTFDLTGLAQADRTQRKRFSSSQIRQLLSRPGSERNVATIVHEATHQLAYNTGLQTRYAGNPFWVAEGLAVYFESPDMKNTRGWRTIGRVNQYRLQMFRQGLRRRPSGRLKQLITDDSIFRSSATAGAAYADAWALNYYLFRKKPKDYVAYLKELSKLQPLETLTAEQRLEQFQRYFGRDLDRLDQDMVRYIARLR